MPAIAHKPTAKDRKTAEAMSGYGIRQEVIACVIGVSEPTLRKHYREDLDRGDGMAQAKIGETLYERAVVDRDTTSLIFLAKTRIGLREVSRVESTGPNGEPIAMTVTYRKWTPKLAKELAKERGEDE